MPWWQWLVDVLAVVLLLVALYAVALVVRRRWISRAGGTFDLSLRAGDLRPGRGWVLGVGRYAEDTLEFFRIFSVVPRPMDVVVRADVEYLGQRPPEASEAQRALRRARDRVLPARGRSGRARHGGVGRHRVPGLAGGRTSGTESPSGLGLSYLPPASADRRSVVATCGGRHTDRAPPTCGGPREEP